MRHRQSWRLGGRFRSGAKDALWALDFFAVRTAKGVWLQALLVIDIHPRELLDPRPVQRLLRQL